MKALRPWLVKHADRFIRSYHDWRLFRSPADDIEITFNFPKLGLFAHLNVVLRCAYRFAPRQKAYAIRCVTPGYCDQPGQDWFGRLFIDRAPLVQPKTQVAINRITRSPTQWRGNMPTLLEAGEVFFAKYAIRDELAARADAFADEHWGNARVLGVHYRGTDKIAEAPRITYEAVIARVREHVLTEAYDLIFVASDEAAFIDALRRDAPRPVIAVDEIRRSQSGQALHLASDGQGLRRAQEALLDCQLLARCHRLVKTASTLSAWAAVLNPTLEVELLNPPHPNTSFFPDNVLARQQQGLPALAGR